MNNKEEKSEDIKKEIKNEENNLEIKMKEIKKEVKIELKKEKKVNNNNSELKKLIKGFQDYLQSLGGDKVNILPKKWKKEFKETLKEILEEEYINDEDNIEKVREELDEEELKSMIREEYEEELTQEVKEEIIDEKRIEFLDDDEIIEEAKAQMREDEDLIESLKDDIREELHEDLLDELRDDEEVIEELKDKIKEEMMKNPDLIQQIMNEVDNIEDRQELMIFSDSTLSWVIINDYISQFKSNYSFKSVDISLDKLVNTKGIPEFNTTYNYARTLGVVTRMLILKADSTTQKNPKIESKDINLQKGGFSINGSEFSLTRTEEESLYLISTIDSLLPHYKIEFLLKKNHGKHQFHNSIWGIDFKRQKFFFIKIEINSNYNDKDKKSNTSIKIRVEEYKLKNGRFPNSNFLFPKPKFHKDDDNEELGKGFSKLGI